MRKSAGGFFVSQHLIARFWYRRGKAAPLFLRSSIKYPATDANDERGALFLEECLRFFIRSVVETDLSIGTRVVLEYSAGFPNMSGGVFALFGLVAKSYL